MHKTVAVIYDAIIKPHNYKNVPAKAFYKILAQNL